LPELRQADGMIPDLQFIAQVGISILILMALAAGALVVVVWLGSPWAERRVREMVRKVDRE
jgi:hypothetical protein